MSKCGDDESTTGNSEADWEIFDILCKDTVSTNIILCTEYLDPRIYCTDYHKYNLSISIIACFLFENTFPIMKIFALIFNCFKQNRKGFQQE